MRSRHLFLTAVLVAGIALLLLLWVPSTFDVPSEETPEREAQPDLRVDPEYEGRMEVEAGDEDIVLRVRTR